MPEAKTLLGGYNQAVACGLTGGGEGGKRNAAFIAAFHADALKVTGGKLVAGALSIDPEIAREAAPAYGIPDDRAYLTVHEMLVGESQREDGARVVIIAIPNKYHFDAAAEAITLGFDVVIEKPMTETLEDARELVRLAEEKGVVTAVTYGYSGHFLAHVGARLVGEGLLGNVHTGVGRYTQGWLDSLLEAQGQRQAEWRGKGKAGCLIDIVTHAYHLVCMMGHLKPLAVKAELRTIVCGRTNDDNVRLTVYCEGNKVIYLDAVQAAAGRENDPEVELWGTGGSLEYKLRSPNEMTVYMRGTHNRVYTKDPGADYAGDDAWRCYAPAGHPDGWDRGLQNVYTGFFLDVVRRIQGQPFDQRTAVYPTVHDGYEGVRLVHAALLSAANDGARVELPV